MGPKMCFGGGSSGNDGAAKAAQQAERSRQARIASGQASIEDAFQPFDDDYYSGYAQKFQNYYEPQIERQKVDADASLQANLASRGIGQSSIAANAISDLFREYSTSKASIADDAQTAANDLRTQVAGNKSDLIALNTATEDPNLAATEAQSRATALIAPPSFSALGDVFASFLQPFKNYQTSQNNRSGTPYQSSTGYSSSSSSGSGRVVS